MPVDDKPGVFVVSPNLTPDPEAGHIAKWSEDDFVKRFREEEDPRSADAHRTVLQLQRRRRPAIDLSWFPYTVETVKQVNGPTIVVEN